MVTNNETSLVYFDVEQRENKKNRKKIQSRRTENKINKSMDEEKEKKNELIFYARE